jgi:hypothetical protein
MGSRYIEIERSDIAEYTHARDGECNCVMRGMRALCLLPHFVRRGSSP